MSNLQISDILFIAIVIWFTSEIWISSQAFSKLDFSKDSGSFFIIYTFIFAGIFLNILYANNYSNYSVSGSVYLQIMGALLMITGVFLRAWSSFTLGKFFRITVMLHDDHQLITSGPYSKLRHPAYAGLLLTVIGFGIALGNPIGFIVSFVLSSVAIIYRIITEEIVLLDEFGDEYKEYSKKTNSLIPFIY